MIGQTAEDTATTKSHLNQSTASKTARNKSLRSRRQSVPTQSFFNRKSGKTPQTKQLTMQHTKQVNISNNINEKENISNIGNKRINNRNKHIATGHGSDSNNIPKPMIKSTDVSVTRVISTTTPNSGIQKKHLQDVQEHQLVV